MFTRALVPFFYYDFYPPRFSPFLFFLQGFNWGGRGNSYYQGQRAGADGAPQGFVRWESDRFKTWYQIGEFVDGKWHGHVVMYGSAGNVLEEGDCLRGDKQNYARKT